MHGGKRKDLFIKNYISRYVDMTCGRVKALEALVKRAVA